MSLLYSLFNVGDCVVVNSSQERAWIVFKHPLQPNDEYVTLDIKMQLDGRLVKHVPSNDITVVTYDDIEIRNQVTTRSNRDSLALDIDNVANESDSDTSGSDINANVPRPIDNRLTRSSVFRAIKDCFSWRTYQPSNKLYNILKEGMNLPKGWIRSIISNDRDNISNPVPQDDDSNAESSNTKQLTPHQNLVLCTISCLFSGYTNANPNTKDHSTMTQHAFDIKRSTHSRIVNRLVATDGTLACKPRNDKGLSVFNSHSKRKASFTAFQTFKKRKNNEFRKTYTRIPNEILKSQFEALPAVERNAYELIAARDRNRAMFLWDELKHLLIRTKGKISYRTMAAQLGNIVSPNTISNWLKQQEGFSVRKDRILPSLDLQAKTRRVIWAQSFWLFWYSARLVNMEKAIFVLVHMDEKWFYAIRTRTNCKVLTSIGLEQSDYRAHHKNHIGKEMYIVVTAYVLRDRNDITKGGTAIPVSLVRVGKMVTATKDSYKRVYRDDGSYHYPKRPENLLRRAGEEYFKPCELTGSSEGTSGKPKMSLLKVYQETIVPDLEEKVVRRYNNNGMRKVVIVKQEDGAGLHQDRTYLKAMQKMFDERGWLLFPQPSQSPVTNVHDACVFPMMSKAVSTLQALIFGSVMLKGEQLYETVNAVWTDDTNQLAMSRAFAGHHQIVLSIMHHEGDNSYLVEKGGLSFGIRTAYIPDHEGKGVIPVPLAPETECETTQGAYLNEQATRRLKYELPDVGDLDKARLSQQMVKLLYNLMDRENMPAGMKAVWDGIIQGAETDSDVDDDDVDDGVLRGNDDGYDGSSDSSSAVSCTIYSDECRSRSSSLGSFAEDETVSDLDLSLGQEDG